MFFKLEFITTAKKNKNDATQVQEQCQARSTIFAKIKTNLDLGSRFFRVNAMRCLGGCGWWNSCRSVHENHHTTAHVAACFVVRSWRPLHPAGQFFPFWVFIRQLGTRDFNILCDRRIVHWNLENMYIKCLGIAKQFLVINMITKSCGHGWHVS